MPCWTRSPPGGAQRRRERALSPGSTRCSGCGLIGPISSQPRRDLRRIIRTLRAGSGGMGIRLITELAQPAEARVRAPRSRVELRRRQAVRRASRARARATSRCRSSPPTGTANRSPCFRLTAETSEHSTCTAPDRREHHAGPAGDGHSPTFAARSWVAMASASTAPSSNATAAGPAVLRRVARIPRGEPQP